MLSQRQELILRLVVDEYLADAKPVASKVIAESGEIEWGSSTVRAELAALEAAGYLSHPHTSAGRIPTEVGYRYYVDRLMEAGVPQAGAGVALELSRLRREIDEAMRETTTALARVTDLMALATAPAPATATIHRVEVLRLQPTKVMAIAIASTGAVAKRVFDFEGLVDPGLVEWASSYLNESLTGMGVGARMIANRLADPELGPAESRFVATLAPAFTELEQETGETLYMEGASRLLSEAHLDDLPRADRLMTALERRAGVLGMLRSALDERSVFLWIGGENPQPELRSVSVVGANYGLAHRNLGSVGVVGPLRMDYATAIASVRGAAHELSRYCETVYGG
ncbi:MAG TPA: heat-inducible transcriptional repressor HrcA [Solirubrobacterales bacterium]|nr:heat-inducible transcriptional repressor HrcA [Solirubrobacterales bacterium]